MENSGFFDAELDESTGTYDLEYLSSQFAAYFAQFIGNGVFGSPTNQLKVRAGNGLKVIVPEGWAFINGYWYHNDSDKELVVPTNASSQIRTDSVMCRFDDSNRRITALYINGSVDVIRDGTYFDLKLAEVIVPPASTSILESNITDTRINEDVCGLVTGLLEVQMTKDLFAQYQSIFDEWFESIEGRLGEDIAGNLQLQITSLEETVNYNTAQISRMNNFLIATLPAGETTLTISDASITTDSTIDIYLWDAYGVNPTEVTVVDGSITLVFDAQETDLNVKVRVM